MEDIKIAFTKEAFVKGFELCQRRVAEKFPELDLGFWAEESSKDEVEPSIAGADLPPTELVVVEPIESAAAPFEVGDLRQLYLFFSFI